MGKLYDYMDRWRTATPVIEPEIEVEYIPPYPKEAALGKKVTKLKMEGDTLVKPQP